MFQKTEQYPKLSVKAIFRFKDKVLYYKTIKGIRDVPGGHIEFGESILDTLKRELNEEIGFNLNFEPELIYNWSYIKKEKLIHRVYFVYLIDLSKQLEFKSKEYPNEIEFIWLNKNKIKEQNFLSDFEKSLLIAAKHKR
ncbi:NUDIX hydrolase [Patescibacteria group bacterium]|nr:NUDIX hydrolase [Patescibacteria group bacterium]